MKYKTMPILLMLNISLFSQTLDQGLESLTQQISSGMTEGNKKKIAVVEFSDLDGKITEFGKYLSEELITKLFKTKMFNVIERQLLNKVLEEHKLNYTGLIDDKTAKEIGKVLGVDAICSGTVTDLITTVKINTRIIDTETGSLFAVASASIQKDEAVKKLMGKVSILPKTVDRIGTSGTINTSGNLIVNGDFKKDLEVGWKKEINWDPSQANFAGRNWAKINSSTLFIHHDGASEIKVWQDVPIISTNLRFSIKIMLREGGYVRTHIKSMMQLQYLDGNKKVLGEERIEMTGGRKKGHKDGPPLDSPVFRHIYFMKTVDNWKTHSSKWLNFEIDIDEELSTYLNGINKNEIKFIRVSMICSGVKGWTGARVALGEAEIYVKYVKLFYK